MTNNTVPQLPKVDPVYFRALLIRNKLVYGLDWVLMRIHTWRTGIPHDGADPRVARRAEA